MTEKNEKVEQEVQEVAEPVVQNEEKPKTEETAATEETKTEAEEVKETPKIEDKTEKTEEEAVAKEITEEKTATADAEVTEEKTETAEEEKAVEQKAAETAEKTEETETEEKKEFDWDSLETDTDSYSAKQRADLEKIYDGTLNVVVEKEVLEGTVIALTKREVVVDIGYKSDGIVSLNEFRYNPELKVGDTVDVFIESLEDKKGQMILSHKKARATRSWERVNEALEKDEIIKGFI